MTSANSPPTSEPESPAPRDDSGPPAAVTLLPERAPLTARTPPSEPGGLARADLLLAVFVITLAFLTASTPAQ